VRTLIYMYVYQVGRSKRVFTSDYRGAIDGNTNIMYTIYYYIFVSDERVLWSGHAFLFIIYKTKNPRGLPVSVHKPLTDPIHSTSYIHILYMHTNRRQIDRPERNIISSTICIRYGCDSTPTREKWPSSSSYRFPSGSGITKGSKTSCSRDRYTNVHVHAHIIII
jgi:hypothetical protein